MEPFYNVVLLYSKENQLYMYIYSLFQISFHLGLHGELSRVPCVPIIFLKSHFLFDFLRTTALLSLSCLLSASPDFVLYVLTFWFVVCQYHLWFLDSNIE